MPALILFLKFPFAGMFFEEYFDYAGFDIVSGIDGYCEIF